MRNLVLLTLLVLMVSSCKQSTSFYRITDSQKISIEDTVLRFDNKNPVALAICDSVMFIICVQTDTSISIFDMKAGTFLNSLGIAGNGPEDVLDPVLISGVHGNKLYLEDTNTKKLLQVLRSNNKFYLSEFMDYHNDIYPSSNLNYSESYFAGRLIGSNKKMFYIYNTTSKTRLDVNFNPYIDNVKDLNYYTSSNISLNSKKNRLIIGFYFIDMCQLYDLKGNLIKSIFFSEKYIPKVDSRSKSLDLSKGYSGFVRMYATEDACYLMRKTELPIIKNGEYIGSTKNMILIKMDWDGNIEKSFKIEDEIQGQFYVDEKNNKLYAIRHVTESDNLDYYDVVTYSIR